MHFKGLFSHDGNSYSAANLEECREIALGAKGLTMQGRDVGICATPDRPIPHSRRAAELEEPYWAGIRFGCKGGRKR